MESKPSHPSQQQRPITVNPALDANAEDYRPFSQQFLKAHPSAAMKAVSNVLMCHVADMFMITMDVMSRKYGHSVEEMINTIKEDAAWKDASLHPVLKSLTYFDQDEFYDLARGTDLSGQVWADTAKKPAAKRPRVGAKRKAAEVEAEDTAMAAKDITTGIMNLQLKCSDAGGYAGGGAGAATEAPKKKPALKLKAAKAAAAAVPVAQTGGMDMT
jgi:hypothetical protein